MLNAARPPSRSYAWLFVAILTGFIAWADASASEPFPALYDVSGVSSNDLLNVRAQPGGAAPIVGRLKPDARNIEVISKTEDGRWGQVALRENGGWVSMRYLTRLRGQNWRHIPTRLRCSGTEPFWSLLYNGEGPTEIEVAFGPIVSAVFNELSAATNDLRSFGALGRMPDGSAASLSIRRQICSDGMSDRPFGLAAFLMLEDANGTFSQAGCCSLR